MKKIIVIALAVAALLPAAALASDANQMKYIQLLAPVAAASSSNSAVNVSAYKGNATFLVQFAPATAATTNTVTLKHSATAGGEFSTVTNIDGTACVITQIGPATNAAQTVAIDLARVHAFVRAYTVQAAETNAVSALLIAPMKSE